MKLSIVIVNYKVKFYLDQCLRSVLKAIDVMWASDTFACEGGNLAEVLVVDNDSRDGSLEYLRGRYPIEYYPYVKFFESHRNLGFAGANNMAIRKAKGEYVLLLNPDTILGEHVLLQCVGFLDAHPDAGALGVRMLTDEGIPARESRRGLPSPMVAMFKILGFCQRWPRHPLFGRYYMGYLPWDEPCRIEVVSGAFCMLRSKALSQVGLLDEDFFMYGEDIDLSCRLLKGGWRNYYLPVDILHYKGESTEKSSFRYVHVFYEAMLIFFRKHYVGMSMFLSLPIKVAIYLRAILALGQMLTGRLRKSLGFFKPHRFCKDHYRLMDADKVSYEQMLAELANYSDGKPKKLAIYTRAIGKVITHREVMNLEEWDNM